MSAKNNKKRNFAILCIYIYFRSKLLQIINMLKALQQFNKKHALFKTDTDKVLLAVSGGVDSMVMLHLMASTGVDIGVAHCNFQLRGDSSDADEQMVLAYCYQHNLQIFKKSFDTKAYAKEKKISIEMAARELRYHWFAELSNTHQYTKIATAHHTGDALETTIYNLCKGTSITGLQGIKPKREDIIRPLLFATRQMIENYAREHAISWRTDESNLESLYSRNMIRNKVVPLLKKINPSLENTSIYTLERLRATASLVDDTVRDLYERAVEQVNNGIKINIHELRQAKYSLLLLSEILNRYDFNYQQVKQIDACLNSIPGKIFYSRQYQLTVDREWLFLNRKDTQVMQHYEISDTTSRLDMQTGSLLFKKYNRQQFAVNTHKNVASVDLEKIQFPIVVRPWEQGDKFKPLGMQGRKKVSDFLIDQKIPLNLKNEIYLLESKKQVVWLINQRLDERFKITDNTRTILEITYLPYD